MISGMLSQYFFCCLHFYRTTQATKTIQSVVNVIQDIFENYTINKNPYTANFGHLNISRPAATSTAKVGRKIIKLNCKSRSL